MIFSTKHLPEDLIKSPIYKQLQDHFYFTYYLSGPKVETLFSQLWGDIQNFTKTNSKQISKEFGLEGKSTSFFKWIAEIAGSIKLGNTKDWSFSTNFNISDLMKFILLYRFLKHAKRIKQIHELDNEERNTPHVILDYNGPYEFIEKSEKLPSYLSKTARAELCRRKEFEESAENDNHYFIFIPNKPIAISIIANRYLSQFGHRFLPFQSRKKNINFFGETIGEAKNLLYLDPIVIGYNEKDSN